MDQNSILLFEIKHKHYRLEAWDNQKRNADVRIYRDCSLLKEFYYPISRICNLKKHFSEIVDNDLCYHCQTTKKEDYCQVCIDKLSSEVICPEETAFNMRCPNCGQGDVGLELLNTDFQHCTLKDPVYGHCVCVSCKHQFIVYTHPNWKRGDHP